MPVCPSASLPVQCDNSHLSYAVALNDLYDLEIKVRVIWFDLDLRLALVHLCTNLVSFIFCSLK